MNTWAVIVAGGSGARYGGMKQLEMLAGKRVLDWAVEAVAKHCERCVVVVPAAKVALIADSLPAEVIVVAGGETRAASVRAGLAAVDHTVTHVLVHDAARPLAGTALVQRVMDALTAGADGAVPVVPVTDTLRTVDGEPVDRSRFVAVQTPQGFVLQVLRDAHCARAEATDDATLVTRNGGVVVHVEGEAKNLKITTSQDMKVAEALL